MYKLLKKILKLDVVFMIPIYCIDIIFCVTRIYLIWGPHSSDNLAGLSFGLNVFIIFVRGAIVTIDLLLLKYMLFNRTDPFIIKQNRWLFINVIFQALGLLACIFLYGFVNADFWTQGFPIAMVQALLITVYLRRHCLKRAVREKLLENYSHGCYSCSEERKKAGYLK